MASTIKVTAGDATEFATPALVVNLFQWVTQPGGGTGVPTRTLAQLAINLAVRRGN
jgi:hypothetical protein